MKRLNTTLYWTLIASEASHVFCCVLPTVFSVLSLLAGVGMVSAVPLWLQGVHGALHHWELPIIMISGLILVLSWALYRHSQKVDCHDSGCHHGPCGTQKKNSNLILRIATILFLVNVSVYLVFHRGMGVFLPEQAVQEQSSHE